MEKEMIMVPADEWAAMKAIVEDLSKKVALILHRDVEYMTQQEVCEMLDISRTTFWRYRKDGLIKVYHIGGKTMVNKTEIQAAINEGLI